MPLRHTPRSRASSLLRCNLSMSSLTHSIQVFLPLPLSLLPATTKSLHFDTHSSAPLRFTCPNHLNLPRLTRSATLIIFKLSSSSCDLFLSFSVTPHIHLTIILSVLSSCCTLATFRGHVSLPYTITLCTHVLYIFPFIFNDIPLTVRIGASSLNFPQAHFTLVLTASSAPP